MKISSYFRCVIFSNFHLRSDQPQSSKMSDSSPTHDSPPPPSITGGVSEPAVANESDTNAKCQTALQSLSSIVTTARDHPSHNLPPPRRQRRLRRDLLSPPTPRLRRRRQQPLPLALRYLPVRGASPPAPRPPLRPLNRWTLDRKSVV